MLYPDFYLQSRQALPEADASVNVEDMALARERRVADQQALAAAAVEARSLLSMHLNLAGPHKRSALADHFFQAALAELRAYLTALTPLLAESGRAEKSGLAYYAALALPPTELKERLLAFERLAPAYRLLDLDVLTVEHGRLGAQVSRQSLGYPPSRCLICSEQAGLCARSRRHDWPELLQAAETLMREHAWQALEDWSLTAVSKALMEELSLSPKPGLVDRLDSGVHDDMDFNSFLRSTLALKSYWQTALRLGRDSAEAPERAFRNLQSFGLLAERQMLAATGGANTHAGLIYSLGLLLLALGRLYRPAAALPGLQDLALEAARLARSVLPADFPADGARREVLEAFPESLGRALPLLRQGGELASLRAFYALLQHLEDKNLARRGGVEGLAAMHAILDPVKVESADAATLAQLQAELARCFKSYRMSPGGVADCLALAFFARSYEELRAAQASAGPLG